MTKKEATEKVNELKKAGYHIITNQENRMKRKGQAGLPDYLAIRQNKILWLELKLKNDTPSILQSHLMAIMKSLALRTKYIVAEFLTEENIDEIIEREMK